MKFTILTPTYNRGYILQNLYRSLQRQTYCDFEWVIVDDGSADDTEKIVAEWSGEENFFPIKYIKKENGGKHTALNAGVLRATGELTFIVDSDDFLTDNSLKTVLGYVDGLPKHKKWAGVAGLKGFDKARGGGGMVGETFDGGFVDATSLKREKFNIFGDKAEVVFTDVLKQFPFKEFSGEKFLTENTVWYKIASAGYKFRWFNEIVYICEYRDDGLTKNLKDIRSKCPQGEKYTKRVYIETNKGFSKLRLVNSYYEDLRESGLSRPDARKYLGVSVGGLALARVAKSIKKCLRRIFR